MSLIKKLYIFSGKIQTRKQAETNLTIIMEDRWHRKRSWCCWPCCRGRSCSSRTSPSPRRSCSSHTLCSKPGRGKSFKFKTKSGFLKSCRQEIFTCVCIRADYCIYIVQSLRFNNMLEMTIACTLYKV